MEPGTLQFTIVAYGVALLVFLILFLIFGLPPLLRWYVKSTGERARAVIKEMHTGRWATYTGAHATGQLSRQQVILKLEVHPNNSPAYLAQDRFMAKAIDLMRFSPGCEMQVARFPGHPTWVVSLPETINASENAPAQARINLAMAKMVEKASHGGRVDPQAMLKSLQAEGLNVRSMKLSDDPKTKLEQLKSMLASGLITEKEFESKKAEILSRI